MRNRVLLMVLAAALPASAAPAAGADERAPVAPAPCQPSVTFLEELHGGLNGAGGGGLVSAVNDAGIAVGTVLDHTSDPRRPVRPLPAYWVGGSLRRVPLPDGFVEGQVEAVNHFGLMVGSLTSPNRTLQKGFRYWAGNSRVTLLEKVDYAGGVNNAGHVVGGGDYDELSLELAPGPLVRRELDPLVEDGYTYSAYAFTLNDHGTILGLSGRAALSGPTVHRDIAERPLWWTATDDAPRSLPVPSDPSDTLDHKRYEVQARALDNGNRIVGSFTDLRPEDPAYHAVAAYWPSPTAAPVRVAPDAAYAPPGATRVVETNATLSAVSSRARLAVGGAYYFWNEGEQRTQVRKAIVWPLSGPFRVLKDPPGTWVDSQAFAVADDGTVGGSVKDPQYRERPVLWTCALAQVE